MAYTISVCDTHRIPYPNATVKAYKLGSAMQTTDQIKFKHGKNGPELGFELKTNARGYFCDNNGDLYTNGVFVSEDAIVKVTMADGTSTTWEVSADNDTLINDGKLLALRTRDSDPDDIEEKWSANSPENFILDYDYLVNKPRINAWMEVEQVVTMEQANDSVAVDKYTKSMTITAEDGVCPANWGLVNGKWKPNDPSKPNGVWALTLTADSERVAQVICVRNWTPWRLALKNSEGKIIEVLDAFGGNHAGKFITLYGQTETLLPYHESIDIEKLAMEHVVEFTSGVQENSETNPLELTEYTPDLLCVKFASNYVGTGPSKLCLKSAMNRARVIKLWLVNEKTSSGLVVEDCGNGNAVIGEIANNTIIELIVNPNGLAQVSDWIRMFGSTLVLDGSYNQNLPPEATFITGSTDNHHYISVYDDLYSEKMIYGSVTNTSSTTKNLRIQFGGAGNEAVLPLVPNAVNRFVIHKQGTHYCIIEPTSGTVSNKYLVVADGVETGNDFYYKVSQTVSTQNTVCVNIPYLMQKAGKNWDDFGSTSESENLVFDISDLVAVGESVTIRFKVDAYTKSHSTSIHSTYIGFGTVDNKTFNVIPLCESVQNDTMCIGRKNIVASITCTAVGVYTATYTLEDTQE